MHNFSDFSKKLKKEHESFLLKEQETLSIKQDNLDDILESIEVVCDNMVYSLLFEDAESLTEEFSKTDLDDALQPLFDLSDSEKKLSGKEIDINGDKLTIDWDGEKGTVSLQLNGEKVDVGDERAPDIQSLIDLIVNVVGKKAQASEPEPEPEPEKKEVSPENKKKLAVLRTIIRPRLIDKFANSSSDKTRIYNAIKGYIESGKDEEYLKTELDQKAIIDFCLDLLDVIMANKNLATLVSRDGTASVLAAEYDPTINEAKEEKKKKKKKKSDSDESVDVKLDMLLKLGLVDSKLYNRAKKALSNKKSAGSVPYLRNILFDLLDKLISYIKKDPTLYNRIRINVMKEMKGTLPTKKHLEEASEAGKKAAAEGLPAEVPEAYASHYFTKEAWLEGYNNYVPGEETNNDEEEMKSFKDFKKDLSLHSESMSLSEIDVITNVLEQLNAISGSPYPSLEEGLDDIALVISELGVQFDKSKVSDDDNSVDLPLESIDGQATVSVFNGESLEDKVEGDLSIKLTIEKGDDGVIIKPDLLATFHGEDAVSLSDIEFEINSDEFEEEPEENDEEELEIPDEEDVEEEPIFEEYVDGETFNVILFKPGTRRFFSTILVAKSQKQLDNEIVKNYPNYIVHAIYPVKVQDRIV